MSEICEVCGPNKQEYPTVMCASCALSVSTSYGNVVRVYKAQPVGRIAVPDLCIVAIVATDTFPSDEGQDRLRTSGERHDAMAIQIEDALHSSLPGGTYDRIMTKMLQRKASCFSVSHAAVFNSEKG